MTITNLDKQNLSSFSNKLQVYKNKIKKKIKMQKKLIKMISKTTILVMTWIKIK